MRRLVILALCALPVIAQARVESCDIGGEPVNPNNGHTTAGKTGLMRCRDRDTQVLVREQELKNGAYLGIVRYYDDKGELKREHSVNARGNRDGVAREFDGKRLVLEETMRDGRNVGLARRWHANGQLERVTFHGDDGRDAMAEFTPQGKLRQLRCAAEPRLAPHADDASWCGHRGGAGTVTLHADDGRVVGSRVHERGEFRRMEDLGRDGKPAVQMEVTHDGGVERSFYASGVLRRERHWALQDKRRVTALEREYHESGTLLRERRWKPDGRTSELVLEQRWYLNGQLREKLAYERSGERLVRHDTGFHDNGQVSSEGRWLIAGRYDERPQGVHKSFDAAGQLRAERFYDERGRIARERELDARGQVERDDAVFEDGSRKAYAR